MAVAPRDLNSWAFGGNLMVTGIIPLISPQSHRRIDQLTFPGLLAAAAWMALRDRRAAAITLATATVEGTAYTEPEKFLTLPDCRFGVSEAHQ